MIYIKPKSHVELDEDIINALDDNGCLALAPIIRFNADDFSDCIVKIKGVEYTEDSPDFWKVYNKAKAWDMLSSD